MPQPVLRFAPSPNGRLHLGHAYSALLNERLARANGGRLLLRIEDIDLTRCRPALEQAIYDDLAWLGLHWETPVRRQSEHFADYRAAFDRLAELGVVYPCFCSRKEIAAVACGCVPGGGELPRDPDGAILYPGTCKILLTGEERAQRIAAGIEHAWRLDMDKAMRLAPASLAYQACGIDRDSGRFSGPAACLCRPGRWGDPVIVRKETPTSYHLSVVVDDALQGVTHVVRGKDIEAATDLHVLLQRLLGLPTPTYHHHALILGRAAEKLSKSIDSESLADLRGRGVTPQDIRRELGFPA